MKSRTIFLILIGLLLQANLFAADIFRSEDEKGTVTFSDKPSQNAQKVQTQPQSNRYLQTVVKVYDGDTIILKNGESVRLLGINTQKLKVVIAQMKPVAKLQNNGYKTNYKTAKST